MNQDLKTINEIKKIQNELALLSKLTKQYQEDYQSNQDLILKTIDSSTQQLHTRLKTIKDNHQHQLLLYLGNQYYICPICETIITNHHQQPLKNKYIIDISSYLDESNYQELIKLFILHIRKTIQRYNAIFTKVINQEVYNYLQKQINNNTILSYVKKYHK